MSGTGQFRVRDHRRTLAHRGGRYRDLSAPFGPIDDGGLSALLLQEPAQDARTSGSGSRFCRGNAGHRLLRSIDEELALEGLDEHSFEEQIQNRWRIQGYTVVPTVMRRLSVSAAHPSGPTSKLTIRRTNRSLLAGALSAMRRVSAVSAWGFRS